MSKLYRNIEPLGDIPEGSLWHKLPSGKFLLADEDDARWLPCEGWEHLFKEEDK